MKERFFAAVNGAMGPNLLRVHTSPGTTGILLRCVQLVFLVIWPLISAVRGRQLLIMSTLTGFMSRGLPALIFHSFYHIKGVNRENIRNYTITW